MSINIYLACLFTKAYALDNIFCKAAAARSVCSWADRPKISFASVSITLAGTASSAQRRLRSQKTELPRFTGRWCSSDILFMGGSCQWLHRVAYSLDSHTCRLGVQSMLLVSSQFLPLDNSRLERSMPKSQQWQQSPTRRSQCYFLSKPYLQLRYCQNKPFLLRLNFQALESPVPLSLESKFGHIHQFSELYTTSGCSTETRRKTYTEAT